MYEVWKVFFFRLDEGQVGVNITGGPLQYQYQVKTKKNDFRISIIFNVGRTTIPSLGKRWWKNR